MSKSLFDVAFNFFISKKNETIREEALSLIREGMSKENIYKELRMTSRAAKTIKKVLRYLPDNEKRRRYIFLNYLLLIVYIVMIGFLIYASVPFVMLFYYAIITAIVAKERFEFYKSAALVSAFGGIIVISLMFTSNDVIWINAITLFILCLLCSIFPFYVIKKLCPNENYTNIKTE